MSIVSEYKALLQKHQETQAVLHDFCEENCAIFERHAELLSLIKEIQDQAWNCRDRVFQLDWKACKLCEKQVSKYDDETIAFLREKQISPRLVFDIGCSCLTKEELQMFRPGFGEPGILNTDFLISQILQQRKGEEIP